MLICAAAASLAPGVDHVAGEVERVMLPGKLVPRGSHLVMAERGAMRRRRALLIGGAIADDRVAIDQRRARIGQRLVDRAANVGEVVTVAGDGVPARRPIAGPPILGPRPVGPTGSAPGR